MMENMACSDNADCIGGCDIVDLECRHRICKPIT